MRLRFSESEIDDLARRYTECQAEDNREREEYLIGLRVQILRRGHLFPNELSTVAYWISNVYGESTADLTQENADTLIEINTRQAFAATDDWEKLEYLTGTGLQGVGQTIASAILHLYDRGQYPIFSQRARESVKPKMGKDLSYHLWRDYIAFCRDIANRNGICMRKLDRALWRYSYENSP